MELITIQTRLELLALTILPSSSVQRKYLAVNPYSLLNCVFLKENSGDFGFS